MKLEWRKVKSTVKPIEVDYESSPTTVYIHKNIVKAEIINDVQYYEYDEAKLTPDEYAIYASDENRKMMSKILELIS